MAEQMQVPVEQIRGYGSDIKSSLQFIITRIILDAYKAKDIKNPVQLLQWGGMIETLHAFVSNYYDENYLKEVEEIRRKIEKNPDNQRYTFRQYNDWFSLICKRLGKFKLLPPLPTSYVEGFGIYG